MNATLPRTPLGDLGDLFRQHLDLSPLRGRGCGTVRCPFHGEDKHPSLSVDLDRGLFHCFSCGVGGGVKKFAELVGAASAGGVRRSGPRESQRSRARRELLDRERWAARRRRRWLPAWLAADHVRELMELVGGARAAVGHLGESPAAWAVLSFAAATEVEAFKTEAALDAFVAKGRLP